MTWQQLTASSHYRAAVAVREALARGETAHASQGLEELIDALSRSEKRALRSQLIRLMSHVIKWQELYELLESATDRCEDVANVIEGIVLKHG